jgi:hypothetical protein
MRISAQAGVPSSARQTNITIAPTNLIIAPLRCPIPIGCDGAAIFVRLEAKETHRVRTGRGTAEVTPSQKAASIQVSAPVLSGIIWGLENPDHGIVEADEMDFERNLAICMPYLGPVVGKYRKWTPLEDRERLFPEGLDRDDP